MIWTYSYLVIVLISAIALIFVLLIAYQIFLKNQHLTRRKGKQPIKVKVIKYEFATTQVSRNHWHSQWLAFVEIKGSDHTFIRNLDYDILIFSKPFKIGQVIKVFEYGSKLYYWHAYEKGIFRLLPPYKE